MSPAANFQPQRSNRVGRKDGSQTSQRRGGLIQQEEAQYRGGLLHASQWACLPPEVSPFVREPDHFFAVRRPARDRSTGGRITSTGFRACRITLLVTLPRSSRRSPPYP